MQILKQKSLKSALIFVVQGFESLTTLENTHWHLFNFNLIFLDKKSPDSLWNLGLSDLHLLRSEKVARTRVTPLRFVIRSLSA